MKNYLLPYPCKRIGWALLLGAFALYIVLALPVKSWLEYTTHIPLAFNILTNIGMLLVILSRERVEDEMIAALRKKTVVQTAYVFLIAASFFSIFFYVASYLNAPTWPSFAWQSFHMYVYDILSVRVLFLIYILIFQFRLWRLRREVRDEK